MKNKKSYITNYLLSLSERSQPMKNGDYKIGFDWIIYQYGLSKDWQPLRLPFIREVSEGVIVHKTEAEFGIDLSFWDRKNNTVIVFVLKAEKLNYNNWISKKFQDDIQRAMFPDLISLEIDLNRIRHYKIVTVYNKDDDKNGIKSYENLINNSNKTIHDNIQVEFERWNIDKLTEEVVQNILSASVLPNNLSGLLEYITSQFSDFEYGTTQWETQLVPNWKNFLNVVFEKGIDERRINLIPFSLLILKNHSKNTPNSLIAWIELVEWAMIKLWDIFPRLNEKLGTIVIGIWFDFYLKELQTYFENNVGLLCSTFGIKVGSIKTSLIPINTANSAYWHIARLGILGLSVVDMQNEEFKKNWLNEYFTCMQAMIKANPSCLCPLIDLHHIEIFLIFALYVANDKKDELLNFFHELQANLQVRRCKNPPIPFISSNNRLDLIAEKMATGIKPIEWEDGSSYLLTMLLELCYIFEENIAIKLINMYFKKIIDIQFEPDTGKIDLVSWTPPDNWNDIVFKERVYSGTGISTSNFEGFSDNNKSKYELIEEFIKESRPRDIKMKDLKRPLVSYFLACIKYKSPLPPEFWRIMIFGDKSDKIKE